MFRGNNPRPLFFITTENGCMVPLSHRLNQDGYFRKVWGSVRKGDRVAEMFHRFIYRAHHGAIPKGHEVDHRCNNRACSNPAHLRTLPVAVHRAHTNHCRHLATA